MKIEGAVVVVTGAAAGLGRATSDRLTAGGAQVIEVDRQFPSEADSSATRATADVTKPEEL